jgi:hypothetical protein
MDTENKPGNGACPPDEAFIRAFINEAGLAEKKALIDHIMSCSRCRQKFQVMRQVRESLKAIEPVPESGFSSSRLSRRLVAVVGSAVLLIGALFLVLKFERSAAYRGNESGQLILLEPGSFVTGPAPVFRWSAVRGADSYLFKLIDEDLNTLLRTGSREPRLAIPLETWSKLTRGKTYVWTVEARDDQSRILDMKSRAFVLK